jgi:HD-GYP domain-containing protein (c-di-GMP phosphodiesterase class II)/pSer/pThr/pTyr-binding forkhead associated (FHA) protein
MKAAHIEILTGPFQGQKHRFHSRATIGRKSDNLVCLLDAKASRTHARIYATKEGFLIEDLESSNGTYINGNKIESILLKSGDKIRIGFTELCFLETGSSEVEEKNLHATIALEKKLPDLGQNEIAERLSAQPEDSLDAQHLQTIMRINRAIGGELKLEMVLEKILEEIFLVLRPERGAIMALNEATGKLDIICSRSEGGSESLSDLLISRSILNRVLEESVGMLIDDATTDDRFSPSESISIDRIRSALCVPLIQRNEVIGIIYADALTQVKAFTEQDLDLLTTIAGPAAVQIQNALYLSQLKRSYKDTIRALAKAVDARDPYTVGHNWRVSRLAVSLASFLDWSKEEIGNAELGGILHDIGKIGIPDSIFLKRERLAEEEWQIMKRHPEIGAQMIAGIDFLEQFIPYILYHHEHWDGSGYPYGLEKKEIPREGRLLLVCDAFDAMTSTRPYRKALEPEDAIEELRRGMAKQFDPRYVNGFMNAWENGNLAVPLKGKEQIEQPPQDYYYSNFRSLIISKEKFADELQMGKQDS